MSNTLRDVIVEVIKTYNINREQSEHPGYYSNDYLTDNLCTAISEFMKNQLD